MASLDERLNEQFGDEMPGSVLAAVNAMVKGSQTGGWLFIAAGVLAGLVAELIVGVGPRPLYYGVGAGVGVWAHMVKQNRENLESPEQPGGTYLILAATATHLVVFSRGMRSLRGMQLSASVPFDDIVSVVPPERVRSKPVTFVLPNDRRWEYVIPKWSDFQAALPDRLSV